MEALKANKIIGNQNDGRAVFLFFQIPVLVTKGFKFHAQPQTGAYSCCSKMLPSWVNWSIICVLPLRVKGPHNVGDFSGRSGRSPG